MPARRRGAGNALGFEIERGIDLAREGASMSVSQEHWRGEGATDARSTSNNAPTIRPPMLGPSDARIPTLAIDPAQLQARPLDKFAGFLISLMDGATSVETLLDLCALPQNEALAILEQLMRDGIVTLRDADAPLPKAPRVPRLARERSAGR
jgi:hypothetical protein